MRIERDVFEDLVRRHHAAVFRTARRVLRSDADAADVTQQVFLMVWRGRANQGDPSLPEPGRLCWLAGRLALTSLRSARRRRRHEQEIANMSPATRSPSLPADELEAVRRSVDALDERDRATIVLRFQDGMTLAAIGQAMGCAESTVHARLRSALDALRHRLREIGFAAAGANLEPLLADAAPVIAVPAGLQTSLLSIPAATGSLAVAKLAAIAVLAVGVGGTALAVARSEDGARPIVVEPIVAQRDLDEPSPAGSNAEAAVQDPERRAVPTPPVRVADAPRVVSPRRPQDPVDGAPRARVGGTITAESDSSPLADAVVIAWCSELSRKAEPFEVRATTDTFGRFALELPVTHKDGLTYRLSLLRDDWVGGFASRDLLVRGGDRRDGFDATMRRWAADEPGEWATEVVVMDGAGRVVPDVGMIVFRRQIDADGRLKLTTEARGRTDHRGRATLTGDHLGEKLLRVIPFGKSFTRVDLEVAVGSAAPPPFEVTLPPDTPLRVLVVDARTNEPVRHAPVTAERDGQSLAVGSSGADGALVLRGIDADPVRLTGGGRTWSRFAVDDVVPGGAVVTLHLKRLDDPEPIGLFFGELHGRVVDALTGEPVLVDDGAVSLFWVPADSPITRESLLVDAITPWPYQTAAFGDPKPPAADFHVQVYQPGRFALLLRHPDRAVAIVGPFDVPEGRIVSGIEIRVETGTRIEVEVRSADGSPVERAEVWISSAGPEAVAARTMRAEELARAGESERRARGARGGLTDAKGSVAFDHIPSGVEIQLHAVDVNRRQGGSEPFRLRLGETAVRKAIVLR